MQPTRFPDQWPPGGDAMAQVIRDTAWNQTALGAIASWTPALRMAVTTALDSPLPTILLWGPDLIQIYNSAYRHVLGERHPVAMGQATRLCWPEVWAFNEPIYLGALGGGAAVHLEDQEYVIEPSGVRESRFFTVTYAPARDQHGDVHGVLVAATETTRRVLAERTANAFSISSTSRSAMGPARWTRSSWKASTSPSSTTSARPCRRRSACRNRPSAGRHSSLNCRTACAPNALTTTPSPPASCWAYFSTSMAWCSAKSTKRRQGSGCAASTSARARAAPLSCARSTALAPNGSRCCAPAPCSSATTRPPTAAPGRMQPLMPRPAFEPAWPSRWCAMAASPASSTCRARRRTTGPKKKSAWRATWPSVAGPPSRPPGPRPNCARSATRASTSSTT